MPVILGALFGAHGTPLNALTPKIAIVAALIVINGLLAMSEIAVGLRATGAAEGDGGAWRDRRETRPPTWPPIPGVSCSTVQIGITLVGVLSGAFSAPRSACGWLNFLVGFGLAAPLANALGIGLVVASITYCALIVGNWCPSRWRCP